jgi:hypothetical protein
MKRTINLVFIVAIILMSKYGQAQGINFQGVARSANGTILAGSNISLKLSIISKTADATPDFVETKTVLTNAQGIFSIIVGDASNKVVLGSFASINWADQLKFLKVEMDPKGGANFISMGTTQLQNVPFSYYSLGVDAANIAGTISVAKGGTGVTSMSELKTALTLNNVNNTTDLTKPISTLTQTALDLKLNAADTSKYTKQTYSDSSLLTKLKISDTAAMLSSRIARDTLNLSNRINLKANATDVTSGLSLKENISNKSTAVDLGGTTPSDVLFPTQKAVKEYISANNSGGGVADGGITTIKLADLAVTDAKINTVSGSKVIGNITGNAATATTAGNITATTNTTLTSLSNLATVGTITSGVWSGTAVAVENGGTGATTASAARTNLGLANVNNTSDANKPVSTAVQSALNTKLNINDTSLVVFHYLRKSGNAATATLAGNITATSNTTLTSLSNLATVGTITSGVWSGTAVAVEKGGTGLTAAGASGQVLTSTGSGTLTWTGTHYIGESYGGGIVFYVYDNGKHGLIAATSDQSTSISWFGGTNTNTRARGDGVGAGLKNTSIIIAVQSGIYTPTYDGSPFAATVCNEYAVTVDGVKYGDWYLPSKHELNLLYLQKTVVGGFASNDYWSSTETNSTTAWYQYFGGGDQVDIPKSYTKNVRAIRAF